MDALDDPFKRRLDDINREMNEILHHSAGMGKKTSSGPSSPGGFGGDHNTRDDGLFSSSCVRPAPSGTLVGATDGPAASHYRSLSAAENIRREVSSAVSKEMVSLDEHIKELISREWDLRVRELDAVLRTRFQDLKSANDQLSESIVTLAESCQSKFLDYDAQLRRLETDTKKRVSDLERDLKSQYREVQRMGDMLTDLDTAHRNDARDVDKRVEEWMKRHGDVVRQSIAAMEEHLQATQREMEVSHRDARKQYESEVDHLERLLGRLHGMVDGSGETMNDLIHRVKELAEGLTASESSVRLCRGEVNRLEVLVRSNSAQQRHVDPAGPVPAGSVSTGDWFRVQQDIFSLKECVAYLYGVLQPHQAAPTPAEFGAPAGGAAATAPVPSARGGPSLTSPTNMPPYITTSTRSTPTKNRQVQPLSSSFQQTSAAALDSPNVVKREASGRWSDGNASGNPSPTYRTVPDSDSEEERQNSRLARSGLD